MGDSSGHSPRLPYRAGLDGVRALAVAAVVLYHARVGEVSGGFLGVDVFFVLSGFLITSLLLDEHARSGTVDLVRFWLGRVRRLLPAALLVIAVSLLAVAILSPADLPSLRGDALWSALYVNNWHQLLADRSYFASFGRPSLLQHFWSLAVEEQFYLLWPPLLLLLLRRLRAPWVGLLALAGAIASLVLMAVLYDPRQDASRVYYGTDTRAMPLLVGVALAFAWPAMRAARPVGGAARAALDVVGLAGLAAVLFGIVAWSDWDPFLYPAGLAIVALGAALLIASVAHPSSNVGRALGCAPLVWVGARSYGIYLWHWPVMAMSRPELDVRASAWVLVPAQIAVTVLLAALSYRWVEMPVRRGVAQARARAWLAGLRASRRRVVLVASPALALLLLAALVALPASAPQLPRGASSSSLAGLVSSAAASRPVSAVDPGAAPASAVPASTGGAAPGELPGPARSAPPAPTRRAAPRRPVLAVGASVMLAASGPLHRRVHARVDAAVSRQPQTIRQRLAAYRAAHALPPVVVVQTGENGPLYREDLVALKAVLRGVPRVILLTVRAPTARWADDTNAKLRELAGGWPQATIADWHAASARAGLLWDGTHPNARGGKVYARVVARAIAR